ncbi:hypothetical protein H4Q26_010334 [Puccinia striiformis f. sp. tritici PST-130]|nr:hypothetical protein H4Q26_010334 [Puccinia striiformis f. sp. tritici PST-130]
MVKCPYFISTVLLTLRGDENGVRQTWGQVIDPSYNHADILQTLPIDCSPSSLEWSNDGQAFGITKSNIYLLTPILGYLVPPEDARNTHIQGEEKVQEQPSHQQHPRIILQIPFFISIIEINKQLGLNWSLHSNDISTITPPNDDRFWRAASWSPLDIRNFQTGLWEICFYVFYWSINGGVEGDKEMDVSPEDDWKLTIEANEKRNRFTSCVLRTQATCLAWSSAYSHSNNTDLENQVIISTMSIFHYLRLVIGEETYPYGGSHTSDGQMELESLNPVCPNGHTINLLSWSNWKLSARPRVDLASATQYQLTAYLAVANSKGVVYLLKIHRPFERPTKPLLPTSHIKIETVGVYQDPLNQSSITYLKWLPSIGNTSSRLVFSRLGEIVLLPLPSTTDCQSSASLLDRAQAIQLPVLHSYDDRLCWADCNSWASCSGISTIPTGIPGHTSIIAMLSNGLIFVIKERIDTSDPSASNSVEIDLEHSIQLSLDFRGKFRMIGFSAHPPPNNVAITKLNVMSVFGSSVLSSLHHLSNDQDHQIHSNDQIALSSGSIMSWLYEIDAPNKFRYKPENYQILQFCLADFSPVGKLDHDPVEPERRTQLLGMLENHIITILPALLTKSVSSILVSPTFKLLNIFNILHSIFSDLGSRESSFIDLLNSNLSKLIDLIQFGKTDDNCSKTLCSTYSDHHQSDKDPSEEKISLRMKSQLIQHIFHNLNLDQLRLRINLCSFLLSRIDKHQFPALRTRLVENKVSLSRLIHRQVLQTIVQFLVHHESPISDDEKAVYKRYQFASKGIDRYPEPTIEQLLEPDQIDHKLLDQDRLSISSDDPLSNPTLVTSTLPDDHLEHCPACSQSVCFDSLRFAICRVGHVWDRCSVTFQILSTIKVRICTGCGRKSKSITSSAEEKKNQEEGQEVEGPSQSEEERVQSLSLVQVLLDSSVCCWHCGGRWRLSS